MKKNAEVIKYLNQYRGIDKKIQYAYETLQTYWDNATKMTPELSGMPRGGGVFGDKISNNVAKIIETKTELVNTWNSLVKTKQEIVEKIDMLENPYATILKYIYIMDMPCTEISTELNYGMSTIYNYHGTALEKMREILELEGIIDKK